MSAQCFTTSNALHEADEAVRRHAAAGALHLLHVLHEADEAVKRRALGVASLLRQAIAEADEAGIGRLKEEFTDQRTPAENLCKPVIRAHRIGAENLQKPATRAAVEQANAERICRAPIKTFRYASRPRARRGLPGAAECAFLRPATINAAVCASADARVYAHARPSTGEKSHAGIETRSHSARWHQHARRAHLALDWAHHSSNAARRADARRMLSRDLPPLPGAARGREEDAARRRPRLRVHAWSVRQVPAPEAQHRAAARRRVRPRVAHLRAELRVSAPPPRFSLWCAADNGSAGGQS
jgi:hypothetical protein